MKRQFKKLIGFAGIAALGISLLAGCTPPKGVEQGAAGSSQNADAASEIKIGLVTQLSGGGALYGKQMENGAQLAVDEINEAGGVLGKKLKLIVQDDQANPSESVKVTQRLVSEERIDAWMGTLKSSDTMTDLTITSKQNIPSLVPIGVADDLVDFLLGSDIHTLRRFVKQDDFRLPDEPLGDNHFLLVPPAQIAH